MKIDKPSTEMVKSLFEGFEKLCPRDRAFKTVEIRNAFHGYYMEKIEVILAIVGEMQKHFKEES
jgi:hypothetical protein